MITMGKTFVASIYVLAAITAAAVAGPLDRSGSCARQCVESSKFNYENGKHYNYLYDMETASTLEGTTQHESRLHMKCNVELHVISNCEMVMKLTGVTLEQSDQYDSSKRAAADEDGSFKRSLESYPLRFAFQNGRVETVCPRDEETVDALNIKRAILSAFQTTTGNLEDSEKVIETDISGTCTTIYESMPRGYRTQSIRKSKDLASCTMRENSLDNILMPSKSRPLLKGTQECTQTYKHNRLDNVQCSETHLLRPFSRQQKSGALTRVKLSLTFEKEGRSSFTGNEYFSGRNELNFDQTEIEEIEKREHVQMAESSLSELCQASVNDIRPSVPRLFTNLVHRLQPLSHPELVNIRRQINRLCRGNERANKMFTDAVAMCGSPGAAKMVAEMASNGDLTDADLKLYLSSLVFVKNPNREMLAAVLPLLDRRDSFLGVSSLVNTYCAKNTNCQDEREIQMIVRKISSSLGSDCVGKDKEETLTILKALGNMGANSEIESTLRQCMENRALGDEIRVAVIQSFRRSPCEKMPMNAMLDMFRNSEEKVEVRITSFIAMMKCVNFEVVNAIKDALNNERINQVGSFVYTFLEQMPRNRRQELDLNKIMDDVALMNKFNTDFRKFSRAFGSNFFLDSMDLGAFTKAHSIFTPEGFLPRSLMLNLTVDIFGNNVNLLEIEGRAEGMERLVESLFGPEGYFRGKPNTDRKMKEERSIELMGQKYNAKGLFQRDSVASMDVKIFGNSMMYKRFGMDNSNSVGMSIDTMSLPEILSALAMDRDYTFTKSAVLFDHTFTVPTASGFPLRLTLDGTTSVDLKIKGKMDMRSMDNIDIAGVFQPSGAIEMSATMTVKATKNARTGLKVVATLHSSTMIDGLLQVKSGRLVKSQINVPRDNIELFDLQTRVFLIKKNNEEHSPPMAYSNDVNTMRKCAGNEMLGMELCGELELPGSRKGMPLFPLNGQTFFKAYLRKTDPTLTRYDFEMSYDDQDKYNFLVKFNTPGSSVDREVSAGIEINYSDINNMPFNMFVRSPITRMTVSGKHTKTEGETRLNFGVSIDNSEKFSVEAGLATSQDNNGISYTPSLVIRGPENNARNIMTVRGKSMIRKNEKYTAELSVEDITAKAIVLKGEISLGTPRSEIQVGLSCSAGEISANGYINSRKNAYAIKSTVEYKIGRGKREKLEVAGKFRDQSANSLLKYSGTSSIQSSAFSEYSTTVTFDTQLTEGHIENSIELNIGDSKTGVLHKITMQEILKYEGILSNNKGEASLRLIYPQRDIDFLVKGEHENTLENINDKMTIRLGPKSEYVVSFSGAMQDRSVNANFKIDSTLGGSIYSLDSVLRQVESEILLNMNSEYMGKNLVKADLTFNDRSDKKKTDVSLKSEVTAYRNPKMTANMKVKTTEGRHYSASADIDMGSGIYAVNTQYTFVSPLNHRASAILQTPRKAYSAEGVMEGTPEQLSLKANVLADRRMTALINVLNSENVKTCTVDLKMDADRNIANAIVMECEYRPEGKKHTGRFSLSYPGNKMSGSFDGSVEGNLSKRAKSNLNAELEYSEGNKLRLEFNGHVNKKSAGSIMQGDVKLQTPFRGMEDMSLNVQHTETPNELKNEINAEFQRGKKIALITEVKANSDPNNFFLDIAARLATPFKDYEYVTGRAAYKYNPADESFTVMARRSSHVFELTGAHSTQPFSVTVNMTTPYVTLSQASAFVTVEPTKAGQFKSQAEIMYNNRNQYTVGVDANTENNGRQRICNLELTATSTLQKYERMNTRMSYIHGRREINANLEASVNNDKLTMKMKGQNGNSRNGNNLEGTFSYSSTMDNFRSGEIVVKHSSDSEKLLSTINGQLFNDITFNSELSYNSADIKEAGFSFNANNVVSKPLSVSGNLKLEGTKLTANALCNVGDSNNRADLAAVLTRGRNQHNVHTKMNVFAPMMGMNDMRLNFEHQRQQMLFTTQMSVSSSRKEIKATHELNINDGTNFVSKLNLFTPTRNYRTVSMVVDQSLSRNGLKHSTEVMITGKKIFAVTCDYASQKTSRYGSATTAKMTLVAPLETLSNAAVDLSYEMDSDRLFYQPKLFVSFNENGRFNFEANVNNANSVPSAMAKLTSSIPNMEDMAFSGKYDLNNNEKVAEASFKYATDKEVTCRMTYAQERNMYTTRITLTTPMRGMRTMGYQGIVSLKRNEKEADLSVTYENKKLSLNGKYTPTSFTISYKTPYNGYENAGLSGSYSGDLQRFNAEMNCEYSNKKMMATLTHETDEKLNTRVVISTPFKGYKNMVANSELQLVGDTKMASFLAQRENQKPARLTGSYEMTDDSLTINLNLETPFKNAEMMKFDSSFGREMNGYRFATHVQYGPEVTKRITMNGQMLGGNDKRIAFSLDTPFRPCMNVEFTAVLNSEELRANLQYDQPSQKSELVCKLKTTTNGFDGSFELRTPYMDTTTAMARFSNQKEEVNGMVELVLPSNNYFKGEGSLKMAPGSYNFELETKTPVMNSRPMNLNGLLKTQSGFSEFQIRATNFAAHPMEMSGNIRGKDIRSLEAALNVNLGRRDEHSVSASMKLPQTGEMNVEIQMRSRMLPTNELNAKLNTNLADKRKMTFDVSLENKNSINKVSGSMRNSRNGFDYELKMNIPCLANDEITSSLSYTNNHKIVNGKFTLTANQETHSFYINLDRNDAMQTIMTVEAQCKLIPSGLFRFEGKLIQAKENGALLTATVVCGDRHTMTAKYNYNKRPYLNMDGSLEMESPMLPKNTLSVNGNFIGEANKRLETMLAIDGLYNGQSRLSMNIRREEGRSLDGLINLNLPSGPVRMFRADLKVKTDGTPQNSELSLDLETSLRNVRHMSLACKSKTSATAFDLSVNARIPVEGMETVSLLTTVHKNREMTRFTPRITLTLPKEKYVLYGNYENENNMVATIGYEMGAEKGEVGVQVGNDEVRITVLTPIKGHESYLVSGNTKVERGRNSLTINFEDATSRRSTFEGSVKYHSMGNFATDFSLRTPYRGFKDITAKVRQSNRRGTFLTSFQCFVEGEKTAYFNLEHQSSSNVAGNLEMIIPFTDISSVKSAYTYGDNKLTMEGEINSVKMLEIETVYRNVEKSFVLSLPSMPYTLKGSYKNENTVEISFLSVAPSRTMGFTSVSQSSPNSFSQTARITLDEKENSAFSYELRSAPRRNGGSEMVARVNLPIRSVEMRVERAPTSNGALTSFDILLDAARNPEKNIKIVFEQSDNNSYRTTARKFQCTVSYPQMRKEMVTRGEYSINAREFFVRGDFEYSKDQSKNFVFEIRAKDQSTDKTECNYNVAIMASHPAAKVDLKMNGDMINNAEVMSAGLSTSFMGQNGRERISELRAKIEKLKQKLEVTTKMNEERTQLLGRFFNKDREFNMEFDHNINDLPNMHGHLRYSKKNRNVDINLSSGEENMNIKGAMPENNMHVELTHTNRNKARVSDVLFHLSLNQDRILESRLNFRPELMSDVNEKVNAMSSKAYNRVSRSVSEYAQAANEEMNYAMRRMDQVAEPEMSLFENSLLAEMKEMKKDSDRMAYNMKQMYKKDEFYMKSIHGSAKEMLNTMSKMGSRMMECMNNCVKSVGNFVSESCSTMAKQMSGAMKSVSDAYQRVQIRLIEMREELQFYIDEMINDAFNYMIMASMDIMDSASVAYEHYYERMADMMAPMMKHLAPVFEKMAKMTASLLNMVSDNMGSFCEGKTCRSFKKMMSDITYEDICQTVSEFYKQTMDGAMNVMKNAAYYTNQVATYVRENRQIVGLNEMVSKSFDRLRQTAYNLGIDTLALNIFEEMYAKTMKIMYASLRNAFEEFSDLKNNVRLTYEPENGRVELKMKLPVATASLTSLKDLESVDFSQLNTLGQMFDPNNFADFYYQYKKYFDPNFYIPPFNGKAIIAGNQHFVTFDNFHFDYAGECSYLLAKDFVDDNFTVYVNYVRDDRLRAVRKSIVMVADGVKIEVGSDYKITKNDVKVELPQEITPNGIRVTMEDGTIYMGDERKGFAVRCNLEHDICTLELSGFYFAKTGGLLGSFNNEPSMDKMTPENRMTENIEEFASSWKIGEKSCKTNNVAKQSAEEPAVKEECAKIFESNDSPMRSCFGLVSPRPFMSMCVNDLTYVRRQTERQRKSCTAIAAYLEKCREEGVELRMPNYCVRCERYDNQEMSGGDMIRITSPSTKSSDVVFVVEQGPCNKNVNQVLSRLANNIEDGLKTNGYGKIRFSVVGFGGEGIHAQPHIVTTDGKAFGSARSMSNSLGNLPLNKNQEPSNVFDALRYAARLPFLAGATKTFVLAKCSSCRAEEMKGDYSEMLRTMLDGDITLHTLFDMELQTKSGVNNNKLSKVIGVDRKVAYTNKEIGDADLLAQLRLPKDLCVPLSLEINGSVFITKKATNKKNLDIYARRIIRTLEVPECQLCECLTTNYGIGKSVCQRCVSPDVASMNIDDLDFYDEKSETPEPPKHKTPKTKKLPNRRREKN